MSTTTSSRAIASAILLALGFSASAQDLSQEIEFNITPKSLPAAIIEFSKQTGVQVVTAGEDVSTLATQGVSEGSIGDTHRRVLESAFRQLAACPVAGTTSVPAGTSTEEAVAERTTYICERGQLRCLFASPHSPPRGDLSRKGVRCFSRRAAAVAQGASPDTGERPATLTRLDACAMTE